MGWNEYYRLLEKYSGDHSRASESELSFARRSTPHKSKRDREIAEDMYFRDLEASRTNGR